MPLQGQPRPIFSSSLQSFTNALKTRRLLLPLTVVMAARIFVLDLVTPLGVTVWILYLAPLLLMLWLPERQPMLWLAAGCTVLIVLGFWFSPQEIAPRYAVVSRGVLFR